MWYMGGVSVTDGTVKMMILKALHPSFKSLPFLFFRAFGKVYPASKISLWEKQYRSYSILICKNCSLFGVTLVLLSCSIYQHGGNVFNFASSQTSSNLLWLIYNPSLSTNWLQHSPGCPPYNLICPNSGPYIAPTSFRPPCHEGEMFVCATVSITQLTFGKNGRGGTYWQKHFYHFFIQAWMLTI